MNRPQPAIVAKPQDERDLADALTEKIRWLCAEYADHPRQTANWEDALAKWTSPKSLENGKATTNSLHICWKCAGRHIRFNQAAQLAWLSAHPLGFGASHSAEYYRLTLGCNSK